MTNFTVSDATGDGIVVNSTTATVNATGLAVNNVGGTHVIAADAGRWNSTGTTLTGTGVKAIKFEGGTITDTRAWGDHPVVYLSGNVTVAAAATLTVPAGAIVKSDVEGKLTVQGGLAVSGVADNRVTFTSIHDDSVGGDTNANAAATAPARGNWNQILVSAATGNADVNFAKVCYAGRTNQSPLSASAGTLRVADSQVLESLSHAVGVTGGAATLLRNRVAGVTGYGFNLTTITGPVTLTDNVIENATLGAYLLNPSTHLSASGNTATGSGRANAIVVSGNTVDDNITWADPLTYHVENGINVSAGASLTLAAGTVVKFNANTGISAFGTLQAVGTSARPVVFTSIRDDTVGGDTNSDGAATVPPRGDWAFLQVNAAAGRLDLSFADLRYGGRSQGSVLASAGTLRLTDSTVSNSANHGVVVNNGTAALLNNRVSGVAGYGLNVVTTNGPVTLADNVIENATLGAYLVNAATNLTASGTTATGSGRANAIVVDGGLIDDSLTWGERLTYFLDDGATVGAGTTLTIAPGTVIKPNTNTSFVVQGTARASGTAAQPIIFTSLKDDAVGGDTNNDGAATSPAAGDWRQFMASQNTSTVTFDRVTLRYFGAAGLTAVHANAGDFAFTGCTVANVVQNGVYVTNAIRTLSLEGTLVRDVGLAGVDTTQVTTNVPLNLRDVRVVNAAGVGFSLNSNSNFDIAGAIFTNTARAGAVQLNDHGVTAARSWPGGYTYYVTSNLPIAASGDLTIGAGAVLKFPPTRGVQIDGKLRADGTPSSPIIFTSLKDDTAGGDTNADGAATTPAAGDWFSIYQSDTRFASPEVAVVFFDNVEVRYAGIEPGPVFTPSVLVDGGTFTMTNSLIRDAADAGFRSRGSFRTQMSLDNVIIRNTLLDGISLRGGVHDIRNVTLDTIGRDAVAIEQITGVGLTVDGLVTRNVSGLDGTRVLSGEINRPLTLGFTPMVVVDHALTVNTNASLTILPGTTVKMLPREPLFGETAIYGRFGPVIASGTPDRPILFTSIFDDAAGGDTNKDGSATAGALGQWEGLISHGGLTLQHVEIRYGGRSNVAAVRHFGGAGSSSGLTIHDVAGGAFAASDVNTTLANSLFYDFRGAGFYHITNFGAGPNAVTLVNNTIHGGDTGLELRVLDSATLLNNAVSGAATQGIYVQNSGRFGPPSRLTFRNNNFFNPAATNGKAAQAPIRSPRCRRGTRNRRRTGLAQLVDPAIRPPR